MELTGSMRKRTVRDFIDEIPEPLLSGKGHYEPPEIEKEHVSPAKPNQRDVNSDIQSRESYDVKRRLKQSLQIISNCQKDIFSLLSKIEQEKESIDKIITDM